MTAFKCNEWVISATKKCLNGYKVQGELYVSSQLRLKEFQDRAKI